MDRNDKMTHGSILEAQANKPPSKSEVRELLLLLLSRLTLKHAK
jgi:TusA-related sulfurtransferase